MNNASNHNKITVGDLVSTAYAHAEGLTSRSEEAQALAARTVARWLARAERLDLIRRMTASDSRISSASRAGTGSHARAA